MSKYTTSFLLALSLHLSLMAMFMVNFEFDDKVPPLPVIEKIPDEVETIEATVLDEQWVADKALELKKAQVAREAKQQAQADHLAAEITAQEQRLEQIKSEQVMALQREKQRIVEQQKAAEEELQRVAAVKKVEQLALQKKQAAEKAEQIRIAVVAREKAEKAKKVEQARVAAVARAKAEKVAEERREVQRQAARQAKAAAETAARIERGVASARLAIMRKVTQNWNQPSMMAEGLACTVRVELIPGGDVMSVQVLKSSGNQLFDNSAERAVWKATPLPVPRANDEFKRFRRFTFVFSPKS